MSGFVTVSVTLNQLENAIGVQVRPYLNGLGDTFEITCGLRRVGRRSDVTIFPGDQAKGYWGHQVRELTNYY